MDIKYVKISDINESPIRHSELPSELIDRIKVFKEKLSEVELIPVETTINNFKCDKNPENEILIWERIANTYTQYLHDNPSTELSFKKDVYSVLLRLTMGVSDFHDVKLTNEQINELFTVMGITRETISTHSEHETFFQHYFEKIVRFFSEESFLLYNPLYCKDPQTSITALKKEAEKLFTKAEAGELLARAKNMLRIAEQASEQCKKSDATENIKHNFYNKLIEVIGGWLIFIAFIGVIYLIGWGYPAYEVRKHLAEGWVVPTGWNCPSDHPIKANLKSMIYHLPYDPYWNNTNAMSGECFNNTASAVKQGFRPIYGSIPYSNIPDTSLYKGGYAPDGTFCDYGYDPKSKSCCNDDDYSCEVRDKAPVGATAVCVDGVYVTDEPKVSACLEHGGVNEDPQFSPF